MIIEVRMAFPLEGEYWPRKDTGDFWSSRNVLYHYLGGSCLQAVSYSSATVTSPTRLSLLKIIWVLTSKKRALWNLGMKRFMFGRLIEIWSNNGEKHEIMLLND